MKEFRLRPRVEYLKTERLHLGWKAPLLEDKRGFFEVHFFLQRRLMSLRWHGLNI